MPEASLIITNSGIPNAVPDPEFIAFGELTLNWADGALYFKNTSGVVQAISSQGAEPLQLDIVPENEAGWVNHQFSISSPPNTNYTFVQKVDGPLPRLKIGQIASGENSVEVDGVDITVSILAGTTTNQIKGLIESDEDANALIYFYNATGSNGTGIADPSLLEFASFINANEKQGTRADYVGQQAVTTHSNGDFSRWEAYEIRPTRWSPMTAGIILNQNTNRWEKFQSQNGAFESYLLTDQTPIPEIA